MQSLRFAAAVAAGVLFVGAAGAHEYKAGDLQIDHPWSRATVPGAKVAGGFLQIENHGVAPDRLIGVSVPFADKAEIHESSVENGVARMRPLENGVEIKPNETVEFAPGGKHLMFVGLGAPLVKGQKVKGELTFEKAGKVEIEFAVEAAGATPGKSPAVDDHAHH
jgi:copper(I)-binding protein